MDCVQDRIMDHFVSSMINGKKYSHDVNKAIVGIACLNKSTWLHMQAFRDDNPDQYRTFRNQGIRDKIAKEYKENNNRVYGGYYSLDDRLKDQGLLTAEPGRNWYAAHFKGWTLLDVLTKVGLIEGCKRNWLAKALHPYTEFLPRALERAKLLTQECGSDWYARHFRGEDLLTVLDKAGFITPDKSVEWFERYFKPLEPHTIYSWDDYSIDRKEGPGYMLYLALRKVELLTLDRSFEWYSARFDGNVLYNAMNHGRAFGRPHEKDKVVKKFKNTRHMLDVIREAQFFDETKDWYSRHVPKVNIEATLKLAGLWNSDLNKDWMAKHLMKTRVFTALVEFDMIGDCDIEWIKANVGKRDIEKALAMK